MCWTSPKRRTDCPPRGGAAGEINLSQRGRGERSQYRRQKRPRQRQGYDAQPGRETALDAEAVAGGGLPAVGQHQRDRDRREETPGAAHASASCGTSPPRPSWVCEAGKHALSDPPRSPFPGYRRPLRLRGVHHHDLGTLRCRRGRVASIPLSTFATRPPGKRRACRGFRGAPCQRCPTGPAHAPCHPGRRPPSVCRPPRRVGGSALSSGARYRRWGGCRVAM